MPVTRDPAACTEGRRERLIAERAWYVFLAALSAWVLVSGVIATASVSPVFCSACHASEARATKTGAHAGATCDRCHVRGGVPGLVENRLHVVSMVFSAPLRAGSGGGQASVGSAACLDCHKDSLARPAASKGLRMDHAAVVRAKWPCTRCHADAGHGHPGTTGGYTMDMCLGCHVVDAGNVGTCSICHVDDRKAEASSSTWEVTHGPNWRSTHGMGEMSTCGACHARGYCLACHAVDVPHPETYLSSHGKDVVSRGGPADCVQCHQTSACDSCHGIEMPHPRGFVQRHSSIVRSSKRSAAVCERCHTKESCDVCHVEHAHPGVPRDQLEMLKAKPVGVKP